MRPPEKLEPLRFRYGHKLGPGLLGLATFPILAAACIHAARTGVALPSRGVLHYFAADPALIWWSAAVLACGAALFFLRGVIGALGPGKSITLTQENLILSGRSATDRERIPYRGIDHVRCADLSTTTATIVIRSGRVEKQFHSGLFDSLPEFYAFWSALRSRVNSTAVQADDPESFERHGSEQRAVESVLGWRVGAAICVAIGVVAVVFAVRHWSDSAGRSPADARAAVTDPALTLPGVTHTAVTGPRPIFLSEQIVTPLQRSEFARLHLVMPFPLPLELTRWVVDRRQQIYFVAQGGGHSEIPHLFALVLPREGITVQVEGWPQEQGAIAERSVEIDWDITSVKLPRRHAAAGPHCLELVRQALQAYGYYGDPTLTREVRVKLPPPTFI